LRKLHDHLKNRFEKFSKFELPELNMKQTVEAEELKQKESPSSNIYKSVIANWLRNSQRTTPILDQQTQC
jgi:hypothetical protein